jgi:C4-dicarboxylate-binding protein DctP
MPKRVFGLVLVLLLVVGLFCGCGTPAEKGKAGGEWEVEKTYTIRLSHVLPEEHPSHLASIEFKEYVEAESDGRIEVQLYPNAQLGSDRQAIEAVQVGTLEMTFPALSVVAGFDNSVMVFDLPFLFGDRESAYAALDGELGQRVADQVEAATGMKIVGYLENGFRNVTNNENPVYEPADLAGKKIRTMENPIHMEIFRKLGASPTPMAFGELYTALRQRTVDAQENPIAIIHSNKFNEVQKYLSLTGHVYAAAPFIINLDFFASLPADLQEVIVAGTEKARDNQRLALQKEEQNMLNDLRDAGMEINELTEEQRLQFVEATAPVYEMFKEEIGAELVDLALKIAKGA